MYKRQCSGSSGRNRTQKGNVQASIQTKGIYIQTQSDTLVDLEENTTKLERKAEIAEQVYEMTCGSGDNDTLREKLIDVMYENEQLKAENSKLREMLNKAYDFMKQFVVDGRNLLEQFMESIGQVVEKVRGGFRR